MTSKLTQAEKQRRAGVRAALRVLVQYEESWPNDTAENRVLSRPQ